MRLEESTMMINDLEYITDANGCRTKVVMPIDEFEDLMIDLVMSRAAREAADDELVPWEQAKSELIAAGKLDA
jgi:hypothetical protein